MDSLSAVILGVVQGATEFLPISSSGHLVLMHAILDSESLNSLAFDAVLQLATVCAVVVYFGDELHLLFQAFMRKLGRMPVNEKDITILKALGIGTIPAVVLGFFLESTMEHTLRNPLIVAGMLVLGSLFFIFAEYRYQNSYHHQEIDMGKGFKIGLFQCLALIPGFSRSGATLAGGMLLGLSRSEATRFAFLLSIPIILGSGLKKLLELITSDIAVTWTPIIVGAVTAFLVGMIAIHFMITFVKKYTLWPFIWYRIILAGFIVYVTFFG